METTHLEITHRSFNRTDLLELRGRLDAMHAPQLRQRIEALFDQGRSRIVLDLAELEYVSSPGLRVLIEARKRARDRRLPDLEAGDLRLARLPLRIKDVFDLTGFTNLFQIYDDVVDAIGSF
jgi:anti-sigma B factor antagonist